MNSRTTSSSWSNSVSVTMSATLTCGARRRKAWTGSARIVHDDQGAYFEINLD
jgi:hypothetical protein